MTAETLPAAAEILLLADQSEEIDIIREAARTGHVNVVELCPEVLAFLRREEGFRDAPRPDLIFLDLDLSNPDHCDTLRGIKEDPDLRRIPVIVIAPGDSRRAVEDAYGLHANAYVVKPRDQEQFMRVMEATLSFWLKLARLPRT